jgi:hypothetical protein
LGAIALITAVEANRIRRNLTATRLKSSPCGSGGKIYSQEIWHNKCDSPYSISSIFLDGASLVKKVPPLDVGSTSIFLHWRARMAWPAVAVLGDVSWQMDHGSLEPRKIDLDNDGVADLAIPIQGTNNYFDGLFWLAAPKDRPETDIDAIANQAAEDSDKLALGVMASAKADALFCNQASGGFLGL